MTCCLFKSFEFSCPSIPFQNTSCTRFIKPTEHQSLRRQGCLLRPMTKAKPKMAGTRTKILMVNRMNGNFALRTLSTKTTLTSTPYTREVVTAAACNTSLEEKSPLMQNTATAVPVKSFTVCVCPYPAHIISMEQTIESA